MKSVLLAITLLSLPSLTRAIDPPPVAWSRTYGPEMPPMPQDSWCQSMYLMPGGDVVTVKDERPSFGAALRIWRHSDAGALRWTYKTPAGTGFTAAGAIPGDAGAILVAGYSATDLVLLKVDAAGSEVWRKSYDAGTNSPEAATGIARSPAGDIYVCGWGGGVNGKDYLLLKYNSAGEQQWHRRYGGVGLGDDVPSAIAAMPGGGAVITGRVKDSSTSRNIVTIRYDDAGNAAWLKTLNAPPSTLPYAVEDDVRMVYDAAGNVTVAGTSGGDIAVARYESSGTAQWTTYVSVTVPATAIAPPQSRFQTIALDGTGRVGIGSATEYNRRDVDFPYRERKYRIYAVIALTPSGVKEWQLNLSEVNVPSLTYSEEGLASMIGLPPGGFIAGGGWMNRKLVLSQIDASGTMLWITDDGFSNSPAAYISAMARDSAGNLYLGAGGSFGAIGSIIIQRRGSNVLPDPPEAFATAADQIGGTSARLNGSVNPNGFSAKYHFEYGPTATMGSRTPDQTLAATGSAVPVGALISGLEGDTQYHFKVVAEGEFGTASSATITFTTLLSEYQNWAAAKFGSHTAPGSGPDEDFDGDGFRNRFEYAFGGDPLVAAPVPGFPAPELFFDEESGFRHLSIVWQENPGATDIRYVPEASGNLQQWTAHSPGSGLITVHALPDNRRRAVARDFQKFMRLRLTPAP